jgi:hypothetical protein
MNVLQSITNCSNNSEYDKNILICNPRSCNFKCSLVINLNRQNEISQDFRVMNDIQKKMFIFENVKREEETNFNGRNFKWHYLLDNKNVCKSFFLKIINHKTPNIIINTFNYKNSAISEIPKRKHWKSHSVHFDTEIKDFILSFNPSHSHYKLNHSPNRKYIDDKYNMCPTRLYKEFAKIKGFES